MKFEFALYIKKKKKKLSERRKGERKGKGQSKSHNEVPCSLPVFSFVAKEGRRHALYVVNARQQNDKPLTPNTNNECLHSAH